MGKNILYKLSDYKPNEENQNNNTDTGTSWLSELVPHLKVNYDRKSEAAGSYEPSERTVTLKGEDYAKLAYPHEVSHYLDHMYPRETAPIGYSRSADTLKTLIKYLGGQFQGQKEDADYWESPLETLARTGETVLPRFRKAVDTDGKIDQRKIDSLAAGKQLTGESIINEPSFIRALMQSSQFNRYPLEGNNNIDMYGNEELRERAKDELYKRMEQFFARSLNTIKDKYEQGDTSFAVKPIDRYLNPRTTAINEMNYRNIDMAPDFGYTPGYDYNLQDIYQIPFKEEKSNALLDSNATVEDILFNRYKKKAEEQQQMLLDRARSNKKR